MNNTVKPDKETVARIFKAFCDPNRLSVLELLQAGEMCACKILEDLNIGQPTLSHHMKILCDAGIVSVRKEGKWMHYSLNLEKMNEIYKSGRFCPCFRDSGKFLYFFCRTYPFGTRMQLQ